MLAGAEEEFTGRRLHRVLERGSEQGVRKAADRLVAQGVVTRRQAGQAKLYSLNRSHLAAGAIEELTTLRLGLVERLRGLVEAWDTPPFALFLFGSVARGEAGIDSDIDLFVVRPTMPTVESPEWQGQLTELENEATVWTGNEARVIEYRRRDLADLEVRKVAQEVLKEGIPIFGTRSLLRKELQKQKP